MRDYMDRRVTPPKRVTSPTWLPHLHVNRSLIRTFPQLFSSYLFATHVNFLTFDKYDVKSSKILFLCPYLNRSLLFLSSDGRTKMKFPKKMKPIKPVLNWLTVRYAPGNSTVARGGGHGLLMEPE